MISTFCVARPACDAARRFQQAARRAQPANSSARFLNCRHITHAAPALSRAARARLILERISGPSAFHL
jgi:hypothetical protein